MKQIPFSHIYKNTVLRGLSIVNVIQRNFEESYSEETSSLSRKGSRPSAEQINSIIVQLLMLLY